MRRRLLLLLGLAAGCGVAFWAGWRLSPVRTVEKTVTRDVIVERKVVEERRAAAVSASVDTREVVRWRTKVIRLPDGTKITEKEAENGTFRAENAHRNEHFERKEAEIRYVDRVVEKERRAEPPKWAAGVDLGLDRLSWRPAWRDVVVQGRVERHVVGPFSVSVWGSSQKAAGVGLVVRW